METEVVTIQEPVSTKTKVEEAPPAVVFDHSSMEVHKVNLSTVLDDEITIGDHRNNIIPEDSDVSEVVNGSGNKETEHEKGEATRTISVLGDSEIVKDDQDSILVHEPQSIKETTEDETIISNDVTLEKKKEEDIIRKPEEVSVEKPVIEDDQTETKHSPEQEKETGDISKPSEEIPIKTEELKEETDSRTAETTVNGTEADHNATVSVEESSRNGDNIVNETVPEKETSTDGESLHETETAKRVLVEAERERDKEETKIDGEPSLNAIEKVERETVKTVKEDPEVVNSEETIVHEPESLKENAKPVEAIKNSDDAEKASHEVTVDREKEEEVPQKTEEVQIEPKDTKEHEHVLERDIPPCETLVVEAVETKEETNEETKPSLELKEEVETVKTVLSSDEVRSSDVQAEVSGEHTESSRPENKDESHERVESVELTPKETVQDESIEEKHEDLLDVPSTESEKYQETKPEITLVANTDSSEKSVKIQSDLTLNVNNEEVKHEKINVDHVEGTQTMEEQRGRDSNGAEAEQIDRNRIDETGEITVTKPVAHPDVEPVEQMQKPSLESLSEVSEETSKTADERTGEKPEEVLTPHQESQVDGSYGLITKEETVSEPKSSELGEKAEEEKRVVDLNPLQKESSQPNEQEAEIKSEKHEPTNEEVKSDEVKEVSSASPSKELKDETIVEAKKIENIKHDEVEQEAAKIQRSLETVDKVESHSSLPSSSETQEQGTVSVKTEDEKVKAEEPVKDTTVDKVGQARDIGSSFTEICSMGQNQPEEQVKESCSRDEQEKEISRNSENIVIETYALHSAESAKEETATNGEALHDIEATKEALEVKKDEKEAEIKTDAIEKEEIETIKTIAEDAKVVNNEETTAHESKILKGKNQEENEEQVEAIKNSDDAEQISSEVTGDREKEEDITQKAEEVKEIPRVIEIPTIQGEDIESKPSLELKEEVVQTPKDTEELKHVLQRDIPQCEILEAQDVDTSTAQEAAILKTSETNIRATEAEQKEAETEKTVNFSNEVRPSVQVDGQSEEVGEHTKPCSSEAKDESSHEKDVNLLDVRSGESEKYQDNEPDTSLVSITESADRVEEITSAVEEGAGLDETTHNQTLLDVESAEKVKKPSLDTPSDLSKETSEDVKIEDKPKEETHHQTLLNVESVEKVQKPSPETPSELSKEKSESVDEKLKIEDEPKEEVTLHQEGQEEISNGLETVSVPGSRELGENPKEEESCRLNDKESDIELQKEQMEKHEPASEEVSTEHQILVEERSDEVINVSSASPSERPEDETVVEAKKIGDIKVDEEEQVADKVHHNSETVETVEPHNLMPLSSEEQEHGTVSEKTDDEKVKETETAALQLDEEEKVTSTEKGEATEDDKHVDSSTSPMFLEKNDKETVSAAAEKGYEEITIATSNTSENVCTQKEEFEEHEAPKLEESKEDKSLEIAETIKAIEATSDQNLPIETSHAHNTPSSESVSEQEDQTPKQVEEIHEEETKEAHKIEAMGDRDLPVEPSQAHQTPSTDLVSASNDQDPKQVEEIHEEETKEAAVPRESSNEPQAPMASKVPDQVTLQEDKCVDDVRETKDAQDEQPISVEAEESVGETKPKEAEAEDEMRDDHVEESQKIAETIKAIEATSDQNLPIETSHAHQEDQTPKQAEEIHEEETKEAHKIKVMDDRDLPVEPSQAHLTPSTSLVSASNDQEPKQVEEIREEETKEAQVQAEDILSTETVPRESSNEPLAPMASKVHDQVGLLENKCGDDIRETKDAQPGQPISVETEESVGETKQKEAEDEMRDDHVETPTSSIISEKNDNETLIAEAKKGDEDNNEEKPEESKEEKNQEVTETAEAIEATGNQTLPSETSLSTELVSRLDDQTPSQAEEIHREEAKEEQKFEATCDQSLPVDTTQEYQTPSLATEQEDQNTKQVEEILEEEIKKAHKVQEILFTELAPREAFREAPDSILASGEDEPGTPQEGNCAKDAQEERHVSEETEERVGETKPEAEGTEKSDDQVENSTKLTKAEDESTQKTNVEMTELTKDYPTEEAEHGDDTYSTLPVVGILTELQTSLETERAMTDSSSLGDNMIKEPADQGKEKGHIEVESNEKVLQEEHKEEVKVQDGISRELEVNVEEKIQKETGETAECKEDIPADQSLTEVLPAEKILIPSSPLPSVELEHVISAEKLEECEPQQDVKASTSEKISLQEEHPRDIETSKEQKEETHETVKEENQIVDIKDEKKNEELQDEKLRGGLSTPRETFSSELKGDKEDQSDLHDVAIPEVEKEKEPQSVLGNEEEITEVVTSEKQVTDTLGAIKIASEAEHGSSEKHFETEVVSDDTKSKNDTDIPTEQAPKDQREEINADKSLSKEAFNGQVQVPSSASQDEQNLLIEKPNEIARPHQSPNQVEETSFEFMKTQEDKNEETAQVLITNEKVQVQDQHKDCEAPAEDKQISEKEQKSNDLTNVQDDIGTDVKQEVHDDEITGDGNDSVVALKKETSLIEENKDVEHVKIELEDAIKHEVPVEEKNNTSEKIDREETKEINQEASKQTYIIKEEIRQDEKGNNQESSNNMKQTDEAINKTQPEIREIKSLSSVSKTQDKSEQKDKVPKLESSTIAEELHQKERESEDAKDLFSEVKESEPTLKEPARKSLSDLIQTKKGENKIEDATTELHMEEEPKPQEEDEDRDHEHKDDKTSPDSLVMVEAKDTVSIIKTHKKSHGILSGVGSKVKHSISKVKKVLTGKSSHTEKPSSPK